MWHLCILIGFINIYTEIKFAWLIFLMNLQVKWKPFYKLILQTLNTELLLSGFAKSVISYINRNMYNMPSYLYYNNENIFLYQLTWGIF